LRKILVIFLLFCYLFNLNTVIYAQTSFNTKFPSFAQLYLNEDKYEKFNRKIFAFNLKLNKLFARKVHILWESILPKIAIEVLNSAYYNIEYPKRLVSSLMQKDIEAVKNETKRFLINTTMGLGGLFDVAYRFFNLEMYNEDMEQALAKCKMKCGNYLILPFISSVTSRDIFGRILDFILTPTSYIASPIAAIVKFGLLINRTAYIQPLIKMVESNFADPYDIARKFYGINKYIKISNFDRKNVQEKIVLKEDKKVIELVENKEVIDVKGKVADSFDVQVGANELNADIILTDYNPQSPILDSIRTALFGIKQTKKSIWLPTSIWNRSFEKKIKSAYIEISPNRQKYQVKYILQKDKKSPLVILFPSVGESSNSSHNVSLANIFYNEGYSVLILGSYFHWEFSKSIEEEHKLGVIKDDIKYVNYLINNSISYLSKKYDRIFMQRIAFGTSLGAYTLLYLANKQFEDGAKNIDKFIAVCPPIQLLFAIEQIDRIIACWRNSNEETASAIALTAAKVMSAYSNKEKIIKDFKGLPFSPYEAKLISAFVFHQKLSDLVYVSNLSDNKIDKQEFYEAVKNINYKDYIEKNFLSKYTKEELSLITSLSSISSYLINSDNYKIFHSMDDYLTNKEQLRELKSYCDEKLVLFDHGSHLGFLYRDEFLNALKEEIKISKH